MNPRFRPGLAAVNAAGVLASAAISAAGRPTHELVYAFPATPYQLSSDNELTLGPDGVFYGGSYSAGEFGCLYKLTPAGVIRPWVFFTGRSGLAKGDGPVGRLILGADGCFYGMTSEGGHVNNHGTLFKVTPAGEVTSLVEFSGREGPHKGSLPKGGLTLGQDGSFYGTTHEGGIESDGTVFKVTPDGVLTTLVEFNGQNGRCPHAAPTLASDGSFYGTTSQDGYIGGTATTGTLFKMTPAGELTTLVRFDTLDGVSTKGMAPRSRLVEGAEGMLYGTTSGGGLYGGGTVFRLSTATGTFTKLLNFRREGPANRGATPGGLHLASDGYFYGTTELGGPSSGDYPWGAGTIFRMTPGGVLTTLLTFTNNGAINKGAAPAGWLAVGDDGSFFGTTAAGGANDAGTVFRMTQPGALTTLGEFSIKGASINGAGPLAGLIEGADGNFYGTCQSGGASGLGSVFKMTPTGLVTPVAQFTGTTGGTKGATPYAGLVQGPDGTLYGTTWKGGTGDHGTVFKITPEGTFATLVEFTNSSPPRLGRYPRGTLVFGDDGNLYGTTESGGGSSGTVFRLTPGGEMTTLVSFSNNGGTNKGANPYAGLVRGPDGSFYGTTFRGGSANEGTAFRVTPAGVLTTLAQFTGVKGAFPSGSIILGDNGSLYGTTTKGGAGDYGTIFELTPTGVLTTLISFTGEGLINRGKYPYAGLTKGPDGELYGTTWAGGTGDHGTVFRLIPQQEMTTLIEFAGYSDQPGTGRNPGYGPLIFGSDRNLYGTTSAGGPEQMGTLFRVRLTDPEPPAPLPEFVGVTFLGGGEARLTWKYLPGRTFVVQASIDLVDWTGVAPLTETDPGIFEAVDALTGSALSRFYRAVAP